MTKLIKIKEKIKLSSEIKMILAEISVFCLGFVLMNTKFIFGIYPFGIAYLCGLRKYTPFGFAGCLLSVVFLQDCDVVYLIALLGVLGLRIASSLIQKRDKRIIVLGEKVKNGTLDSIFCENTEVRVAISVLCAFGISLYRVIASGYSYYEIFVLIFFSILVGMLTYALSISKKGKGMLGYGVICFALIYAIKDFSIFSLDVSIVLGFGLTLYISRYLGSVKAGAYGLILGLSLSPALAPIFGIGGLASGLLWGVSYYLAIMCASVLAVGYSIFVGGYSSLITVTPSVIFVALLIYPLLRFKIIPAPEFIKASTESQKSIDTVVLEHKSNNDEQMLSSLADTFEDIALTLTQINSNEIIPTREGLHTLCLDVCEEYCYNCPKHFICWQNDINTTKNNLKRLSQALFSDGSVSKASVEEKFLHRCPNIDTILDTINRVSTEAVENNIRYNKLEAVSNDYLQISMLISELIEIKKENAVNDTRLSEKLSRAFAKIGLIFEDVSIIGKEYKEIFITGVNIERSKCAVEELKNEIEAQIQSKIDEPIFNEENGIAIITAKTRLIYSANEYHSSKMKDGEQINGDSLEFFDGLYSKRYALLCDGMGSGLGASITSSSCVSLLKSILKITDNTEIALSMINNLIRARGLESCSTVDLLEIDLLTGKGSITKCGASVTYIKRNDKVFKLQSKTMPIGILKDLDAEKLSFELTEGDICIMVSDGVVDPKFDDSKTVKFIEEFDGSIDTLPQKILDEAKKQCDDDMSVCAVQLHRR
ncbi:MAG: SpoIIE family protein phosphatase [Clostridia bacterium]|nr:SpoIIE family protein phosphatase [Clostridia bacterium]